MKVTNVQQYSVDLSWNRPLQVNGEAMTYALWFNGREININDNNTMNETFAFTLRQLEVFTEYTITVLACTSGCSVKSESLNVRTAMGEPSKIMQPKLESLDKHKVILNWDAPKVAGGNLNFFQLKFTSCLENESVQERTYRIHRNARGCILKGLECDAGQIDFALRAVNVHYESTEDFTESELLPDTNVNCLSLPEPDKIERDIKYYGEWSPAVTYFCSNPASKLMVFVAIVAAPLWLTSIYAFWKLYQKYKRMKDINIVWPRGLDPEASDAPPTDVFGPKPDFDLLRNCPLTNVEEDGESVERDEFLPGQAFLNQQSDKHRNAVIKEMILPLRNYSNDLSLKKSEFAAVRTFKSEPATPDMSHSANPHVDLNSGYMKMHPPRRSQTEANSPTAGYLDMTGKLPVNSPIAHQASHTPTENDYIVRKFIKDSEMNNNGYIGKRATIIVDQSKKRPPIVINPNGYVGIQKK